MAQRLARLLPKLKFASSIPTRSFTLPFNVSRLLSSLSKLCWGQFNELTDLPNKMLHYITFMRHGRLFWLSCITGTLKRFFTYLPGTSITEDTHYTYLFAIWHKNQYKLVINSSISLTIFAKTLIQFSTVVFLSTGWMRHMQCWSCFRPSFFTFCQL